MNQYGKIISMNRDGNVVTIEFESGTLEVHILTQQIIRFYSQMTETYVKSKAIIHDETVTAEFEAIQNESFVQIRTCDLIIHIGENGMTDIFDKNGLPICIDYKAERKYLKEYNQADADLMAQEGHAVQNAENGHRIQVVKKMDGDECFYGLGDKTGFLNKRGYEYICWNTDNPDPHVETFKALYKSIPFFITLKKQCVYGLFFDNTYRTFFDFGKESDQYFWFGSDEGSLNYYFIGGNSMKEVVSGYMQLTGTAPLPQFWTLGYHQSRWGYKTEKDVRSIAENMRKHDIPCDAVHLDIDYMEQYKVFTIDSEKFPDFRMLAEDMAEEGIHIVTIMDPGVKVEAGYPVYEEGIKQGYFAVTSDGNVYQNVVWPGDSVYPDFGRAEVRRWWGENYKFLVDAGAAGIWTDMNEPASFHGELPEDVVFYDEDRKSCHSEQHNLYGHNMARATYKGLERLTGKRPFVITRACYSGTQKYSIVWTGDNQSLWVHLQMAIPQLCNLGLSGIPFAGTDIGGFSADTTKELLCRWIQVGAFSPFCRNHSSVGTRAQEPWAFDEETLRIYRTYLKLRYSLLPYIYDLCAEESVNGLPVMRPLVLNYESDENAKNMNGQFMLGDSILVAPVLEQGARQKMVYLPEGIWYDYWTREKVEGGKYLIRKAELDECPVYVKAGSMIPMYKPGRFAAEYKDTELYLDVFPGNDRIEYLHYQDNGEDFGYRSGEYNLYQFIWKDEKLSVKMRHNGYKREYTKISVIGTAVEG